MNKLGKHEKALESWKGLNDFIMTTNESDCESLINIELLTKKRKMFVLRIHSRLNKLRAARERRNLLKQIK